MKKRLFYLFFGISTFLNAQNNTEFLKEINRDIWSPFIEAYGTCNSELYKSLQSPDFIRAEGNQKQLPTYKDYFDNVASWFNDVKTNGQKLAIAFRFTERFANGVVASERGIYELKTFNKEGKETWKDYGKFHVFMRKIEGKWKIVVDYDSNEGDTINEESYKKAFAIDAYDKY